MKKTLVFLVMMLSLVGVMGMVMAINQPFDGTTVDITLDPVELNFGSIFGAGPTDSLGTTFVVNPNSAISDFGLFVDDISATITGTATVEYSEDDGVIDDWTALSETPTDTTINLVDGSPTLWIRLNSISGPNDITGTIDYTVMNAFTP